MHFDNEITRDSFDRRLRHHRFFFSHKTARLELQDHIYCEFARLRLKHLRLGWSTLVLAMILTLILLASLETTVIGLLGSKLVMSTPSVDNPMSLATPIRSNAEYKRTMTMVTAAIPLAMAVTNPRATSAAHAVPEGVKPKDTTNLPLGENGYTDLGGLPMCRILNGMWQVSGSHGYQPLKEKAVAEMSHCAGYVTCRSHPEVCSRYR
jgi:hypothetical protein